MNNFEDVSIEDIKVGDTVLVEGIARTVCKKDINYDGFMGVTLWGDSRNIGNKLLKRVIYGKCKERT